MSYTVGYELDGTPGSISPDGIKWIPLDVRNPDFLRYLVAVQEGREENVLPEDLKTKFQNVAMNWKDGKDLMAERRR